MIQWNTNENGIENYDSALKFKSENRKQKNRTENDLIFQYNNHIDNIWMVLVQNEQVNDACNDHFG